MNDDLSYEEIARVLGRSVSTVKSSVFFALEKLKKMVQRNAGVAILVTIMSVYV